MSKPSDPAPDRDTALACELLGSGPRTLFSSQIVAFAVVAALYRHVDADRLLLWITLFSAINLVRLAWVLLERGDCTAHPRRTLRYYAAGALLGGLAWGLLPMIYHAGLPLTEQLLMLTVLVCLPPASLPSNAVHPPTFLAFSLPVFAALLWWGGMQAPGHNPAFVFIALAYAGLIVTSGLRYARLLRENLERDAENRHLLHELEQANRRLRRFAYEDPLTELSNRRRFDEHAAEAIEQARRHGEALALLLIDIDDFKRVNDTHGHETGDRLLRAIAERIRSASRQSELVALTHCEAARIGGDEFAVLYRAPPGRLDVEIIAQRILDVLTRPLTLAGVPYRPRVSIGVACARPGRREDLGALLRRADAAMYRAKQAGGHRIDVHRDEDGCRDTPE